MRRIAAVLVLAGASACAPTDGGLTADLHFADHPDLKGVRQQGLRPAALPAFVARLEIGAFAVDGSTLGVTLLDLEPAAGEEQLFAEGGTWQIDSIPAQEGVTLRAKAIVRGIDPTVDGAVAYVGVQRDITVQAGVIADVGPIVLEPAPVRVPAVDFEAPRAPSVMDLSSLPEGEGFSLTLGVQTEPDLTGWLVLSSDSSTAAPELTRGMSVNLGDTIGNAVVQAILPASMPTVEVTGLADGAALDVFVYSFDSDADGPLNFSRPTERSVTIRDAVAPGPFVGLSALPIAGGVQLSATAPGEDGVVGTPAGYEVRSAIDASRLDLDRFVTANVVSPPMPVPGGSALTFDRSYGELGVNGQESFHIGIRAVDAGGNTGPISVVEFVANATAAPQLDRVDPPIVSAGSEIRLRGLGFGVRTGTVTLTFTETGAQTIVLPVAAWNNSEILVRVPTTARTGRLEITPPGAATVGASVTVLLRNDDIFESSIEAPFAYIGTGRSDDRSASALYRERGFSDTGAIIRLFDGVSEEIAYGELNQNDPSTAISGDYDPALDRFLFVASTPDTTMTTAIVSSSTLAAAPFRVPTGVLAGGADAVDIEILGGGLPGEVPALLTFTRQGTLRTATVADARVQAFDGFIARTSTSVDYEGVTMARRDDGAVILVYRSTDRRDPSRSTLSIQRQAAPITPDGFTVVAGNSPPPASGAMKVVPAARVFGGPQEFFVAYQHTPASGPRRIRLLQDTNYGVRPGYAPFDQDLELEDLGIVIREGEIYLAVVGVLRSEESTELHYTEVPISALAPMLPADGSHPGVRLDIAPADAAARLACTEAPQRFCPLAWIGPSTRALYLRR